MSWQRVASGIFASHPVEIEGPVRVVAGLKEIVGLMKEEQSEPKIIVTNVAGGSAVSTIIRRAKAIVSTIGGPNSHIVVVARDYNLPCIVGAADLDLDVIANGTPMRMREDGSIEIMITGEQGASLDEMSLLRTVAFAGALEDENAILGFTGDIKATLRSLSTSGLLETDGVITLSPAGEDVLAAWYASDRSKLDETHKEKLHQAFRPLDLKLKTIANAWQDADAKDDWDRRLQAIEALSALHDSTLVFLDEHLPLLPRLEEYRSRLVTASEKVLDGDTDYFVGVRVDSYHTAWFNFHEDLLRLLEREREPE